MNMNKKVHKYRQCTFGKTKTERAHSTASIYFGSWNMRTMHTNIFAGLENNIFLLTGVYRKNIELIRRGSDFCKSLLCRITPPPPPPPPPLPRNSSWKEISQSYVCLQFICLLCNCFVVFRRPWHCHCTALSKISIESDTRNELYKRAGYREIRDWDELSILQQSPDPWQTIPCYVMKW